MFKVKHSTTKELRKGCKFFLIMLTIIAVISILTSPFGDKHITNILLILTVVYASLTVMIFQIYLFRLNLEIECKLASKDFMDYCPCKHCRLRRKEE